MTTLEEIEKAADALPIEQQEVLLRQLRRNLVQRRLNAGLWPVLPPDVPIEELRRVHATIEEEFPIQAGVRNGLHVAPPKVPLEEIERIEALIEAEFSHVDPSGW